MENSPEIMVFASNLKGVHGAGSALAAKEHFGAKDGVGVGPTGSAYAIPTKYEPTMEPQHIIPLPEINNYVRDFLHYAEQHPTTIFKVVKIGCGLSGYHESQIIPMFLTAPENCQLPPGWRGEYGFLKRVCSGGNFGADIGGVVAAERLGLVTGGFMPLGFKTSKGNRPEFAQRFNMVELDTTDYKPRTEKNVLASDATLILSPNPNSAGTKLTVRYCIAHNKPYLLISEIKSEQLLYVRDWLLTHKPKTLNVAGNRESVAGEGFTKAVAGFLTRVFRMIVIPTNKQVL